MLSPYDACPQIHKICEALPAYHGPSEVPYDNGLCLFYEKGEVTAHAPNGRIVRVENHKLSESLKSRIALDYSGDKNSSEFRKFIGAAILLRDIPDYELSAGDFISLKNTSSAADEVFRVRRLRGECLDTTFGSQGHWATNEPTCEKCRPIEDKISKLFSDGHFWFRCIKIEDKNLRGTFERKLVATLSICSVHKDDHISKSWLGRFAMKYNSTIACWGLWNVEWVAEKGFLSRNLLNEKDVEILENLVASTLKHV